MVNFRRYFPAKRYKWHVTSLTNLKDMIKLRQNNQFDNIVLITGARGTGKSTLAGKILFQFEEFDPWESMVYSKETLFKLAKQKKKLIWCDEAIINVSRGNVMSRANKLLHELFTISRSNYNITFLLLPSIEDFDVKILQYCSMWLNVDKRGLAVMLLPVNKGLFGRDIWDIDNMKKIYEEFKKDKKETSHIPYWVFESFRGYVKFGKLTKEQEQIINEIKDLRKNENLDKEMQEQVTIEVKEAEQTQKYVAKKLSELVIKGEIRSIEQFNKTCEEYKLNSEELIKKCDSILKRNNFGTIKGKLREYKKEDELIRF